jgi:hypothetical protein
MLAMAVAAMASSRRVITKDMAGSLHIVGPDDARLSTA